MSDGANGDVLSAALAGDDLTGFFLDDAGGDAPALEPAVEEPSEPAAPRAEGQLKPAEAAHPAPQTPTDEPPAWARELLARLGPQAAVPAPAPPEAPPVPGLDDFFADPAAFVRSMAQPQTDRTMVVAVSELRATQSVGAEAVKSAREALEAEVRSGRLPGDKVNEMLSASPDPYGEIVRWHQGRQHQQAQQKIQQEIGGDLNAYREKVRAEILAEMQAGGSAPVASGNVTAIQPRDQTGKFIPSLGKATNAGREDGPQTDDDIFRAAMNGR